MRIGAAAGCSFLRTKRGKLCCPLTAVLLAAVSDDDDDGIVMLVMLLF